MSAELDHNRVRALLAEHRSMDALMAVDAHLDQVPADLEAQTLRIECLIAIGRFETALELARRLRELAPAQTSASRLAAMLEENLSNPTGSQRAVTWRDSRSEIPHSFLLRMQRSLHAYTYRGVQLVKDPFDLALYPLLLWRLAPGTIVEIGSKAGGSALYFGDLLTNFGINGHVHSYDLFPVEGVEHPRVTFHRGDGQRLDETIDAGTVAGWARPLLIVEDADHSYETSIAVLRFFDAHLQTGDWIVTEDGNLSDLYPTLYPDGTSGPHLALREFLATHEGHYRIASELCDFFAYNATANSNGFLERIDGTAPQNLLTDRAWRRVKPSAETLAVPTMLSVDERALLYWLARDYWSGAGRIIDAGCFLGGSTMALAAGLRDRGDSILPPPIVVFDRFVVEEYTIDGGFFADAPELQAGDDFRPLFDRYLRGYEELLDVRGGDIRNQSWSGEPIEIHFLDVLKSWELNDAVVREFWPSLIPGKAIVVQQDYQYSGVPWLAMTMEQFGDCFERIDELPWATVMYRLTRPLPDLRRIPLSHDLPAHEQLALMDRAVARETTPQGEAMLRLSRALLLYFLDRSDDAQAELAAIRRAQGDNATVGQAADSIEEWFRFVAEDPALRQERIWRGGDA